MDITDTNGNNYHSPTNLVKKSSTGSYEIHSRQYPSASLVGSTVLKYGNAFGYATLEVIAESVTYTYSYTVERQDPVIVINYDTFYSTSLTKAEVLTGEVGPGDSGGSIYYKVDSTRAIMVGLVVGGNGSGTNHQSVQGEYIFFTPIYLPINQGFVIQYS